jgi:hypothetical protein
MSTVLPDDVWWHLMLSEWTGPVTLADLDGWALPQIARALVVSEAMDARARYDAAVREARRG